MAAKRLNHNLRLIRQDYTYTTLEVAKLLGVDAATVLRWVRLEGLKPIPHTRPYLFYSGLLIDFLQTRQTKRRCECTAEQMYCLKCRTPRFMLEGSLYTQPTKNRFIRLMGQCACCGSKMSKVVKPENWVLIHPLYLCTQPSVGEHKVQQQNQPQCSIQKGEQLCLNLTP